MFIWSKEVFIVYQKILPFAPKLGIWQLKNLKDKPLYTVEPHFQGNGKI